MKNEPTWKRINDKLLHRYEISEGGIVRVVTEERIIPSFFDDTKIECVMLICRGRQKRYTIRELMLSTFNSNNIEDKHIPNMDFLEKPEQFSENEEDYGRNENKIHWEEIRSLGKKATENEEYRKRNLE